ncbi:MAG: hypothetical protein RR537_01975 [Longicatena sp.]
MRIENKKHRNILVLCLSLVLVAGIGVTYALLTHKTDAATNKFQGANVNIAVMENGKAHEDSTNQDEIYTNISKGSTVEKIVSVKNVTSETYPTTDTYTRVRLVPMFIKDDAVNESMNAEIDLTYTMETNTAWKTDGNGNYYYTKVLAPGDTSEELLKSVKLSSDVPTGYHLEVKVLADAIQARPSASLQNAWGISSFDGLNDIGSTVTVK